MSERPDNVPPHAERLDLFKFTTTVRRPSKFVPGCEAVIPVFVCPGCTERREMPFEPYACSCGLTMRAGVTALFVWPTKLRVVA